MKLHLHVKTIYFNAIKSGEKKNEYRLMNAYWQKRLIGRNYDGIVLYNGFKPGTENRIEMPYKGCSPDVITHPHFGDFPAQVFAIPMTVKK